MINTPKPITWSEVLELSPRELEVFIRQRLGQKDAIFRRESIPDTLDKPDHRRFDFDAGSNYHKDFKGIINNMEVLALFGDLIPVPTFVHSHKGAIWISVIRDRDYNLTTFDLSGYSTIDIITALIKRDFPKD